jgi:hypothetical protein
VTDENGTPIPHGEALQDGRDRPHSSFGTSTCGCTVSNGKTLSYQLESPTAVDAVHITFNSDLNRDSLPGGHVERTRSMRANVTLDSPIMHMPLPLCRAFRLEIDTADGARIEHTVTDNTRRAHHVTVERKDVTAIRLTILENWGGSTETDLYSFDFM